LSIVLPQKSKSIFFSENFHRKKPCKNHLQLSSNITNDQIHISFISSKYLPIVFIRFYCYLTLTSIITFELFLLCLCTSILISFLFHLLSSLEKIILEILDHSRDHKNMAATANISKKRKVNYRNSLLLFLLTSDF